MSEDRISLLRGRVSEAELDGLLVTTPLNLSYLCGFTGSAGALVVLGERPAVFLTDSRYEGVAGEQLAAGIQLRIVTEGIFSELSAVLDAVSAEAKIGFEPGHLTVGDHADLQERCAEVRWKAAPPMVELMRGRKTAAELERIRDAVRIAEAALARALERVERGMTERQLAARLEYELRGGGSERLPFDVMVASGPRSALPHSEPVDRQLRDGDLLLIDFGAASGGYCCDLTRTFVLGPAAEWQREIHDAVRAAQAAATERIAVGTPGAEVDAAAREVIDAHGHADRFGHSVGHGIGLEVHEGPSLSKRSTDVLAAGHVVTVEPGVYLPGHGGVRIEDDVHVTEDGPITLTSLSKELREL